MKKTVLSCLLALVAGSALAQSADLVITPRLEGSMTKLVSETKPSFDMGQSSVYVDLDGVFANENFSYSVEAQLLNTDPVSLYNYAAPFENGTWLNWAYLSYDNGFFGADLGKIALNTGLFEYDAYDWQSYANLASNTWNNITVYQYGATLRLTPWETQVFEGQIATSPSMVSLSNFDLAYSFCWKGSFGGFSARAALLRHRFTEEDARGWFSQIGVGLRYDFEKCNIQIDGTNGTFATLSGWEQSEFTGRFNYTAGENKLFHCGAFFGIQNLDLPYYGGYVEFYPLKDDNFRIHGTVSRRAYDIASDTYGSYTTATVGLIYSFNIHLGK